MSQEKIFADGFSFKRNENAPDFVVGRLSMKVKEAMAFMQQHEKNGWVNISIKYARSGNAYCELDTFESSKTPKEEGSMSKNHGDMLKNEPNMSKNEGDMSNLTPDFNPFSDDDIPF